MEVTAQMYHAVFEHGVFRVVPPLHINIPEGPEVRLVVEPIESSEDIMVQEVLLDIDYVRLL